MSSEAYAARVAVVRARAARKEAERKASRRAKARLAARKIYRRAHPAPGYSGCEVPVASLKFLDSLCREREVIGIGRVRSVARCMTQRELAAAMGRTLALIQQWTHRGRFPAATHWAMGSKKRRVGCFLEGQVADILYAFTVHLLDVSDHYRADHEALRLAFFGAVQHTRAPDA